MHFILGTALLSVLLAISPLNKYVFRTVNTEEVKRKGRARVVAAQQLMDEQKYAVARDSFRAIVNDFKPRRDPISEYLVHHSMLQIGYTYEREWLYDDAIQAYGKLVKEYPQTPFAEQVFYKRGRCFMELEKYRGAIKEFENIEKNRPVARYFPKYKYTDLEPEKYVNLDKLSSVGKKKEKVKVYTREIQEQEAKGKKDDEEGGNLLSDVVVEIGKCYMELNETHNARQQFSLIGTFFPGSDRMDDAQKLIADSYLKDGRLFREKAQREKSDPSEKQRLEQRAMTNFNRAALAYQKFVNVYTQSELLSDAYIQLGDVHYKMNDVKGAEFAFSRAIHVVKEPDRQAKVQLDIGTYFSGEEKYKEAVDAYAKVLQNYSKSKYASNAVYLTGESYEQKGDTGKSIEYFSKLVEFYKSSQFFPSASYKLGLKYGRLGDHKKALEHFRKGVQLFPNNPLAPQTQFQIGVLFMDRKEFPAAIEEFEYLVNQYPESDMAARGLFKMVDCYKRMGQMDKARATADRIKDNSEMIIESYKLILGTEISTPEEELKLWKNKVAEAGNDKKAFVAALMEVARIQLHKLGLLDSAMMNYQVVLDSTEDEVRKINAKVGIGEIHTQRGAYDSARAIYQEILDNPKTSNQVKVQIEYKVHDSYRREKKYDKALEGLRVFVEQYRSNDLAPYAQFSIGVCFSEQDQHEKAIEEYNKVLHDFSNSDVVGQTHLAVGSAYKSMKQFDRAVQYWADVVKQTPGMDVEPQLHFHTGIIYKSDKEMPRKAVAYFERIIEYHSDVMFYSTAAYLLGECYRDLKMDKKAVEIFDKVKEEDKDVRRAADAEIGKILGKTNPRAAIASYDKIIQNADTDMERAIAEMGKGDIYMGAKMRRPLLAAQSYHKIYAEYKEASDTIRGGALVKEIDAYNQLAQKNKRHYKKVIRLADFMVKEFPDNPYMINAVYFKANAYYSSNEYGRARRVFQKIIKLDKLPEITEVAWYQKADCLLFMERYDEAIREYRMYLRKYPRGKYAPICIYQIGNCYWAQEDFARAKQQYEKVVSKYPKFSEICSAKGFLGYCLDQLDQWRRARKLYREVLNDSRCKGEARKFAKDQLEANMVQH